jgi:hypothetical protein
MKVCWKDAADEQRLAALVDAARDAKQRDRYRVVLIAGQGLGDQAELERERIAATVGRSRQFVDEWVGRYRRAGVDALVPKPQPGAARRLGAEQEAQLCAMLGAGPPPAEGIVAYNGPILRDRLAAAGYSARRSTITSTSLAPSAPRPATRRGWSPRT